MKKMILLSLIALILSGCSHQPLSNFSYGDRPLFTTTPQTKDYVELGHVSASASGFVWNDCNMIANKAIDRLLYEAQAMGGNAVAQVYISNCTTQYGWFALYILPGLGPWVRSVDVKGIAIKREMSSPSNK